MADTDTVKGTERAAILLLSLGEDAAASVFKHMNVEEVKQLGSAMAAVNDVPRDQVASVLGEMLVAVEDKTSIGVGNADYLRKVLNDSLGERKAGGLLERILPGRESSGIEALQWMDPRTVAEVIRDEHPQIVATILAHLNPEQAASVIQQFSSEVQSEVALRIAKLEEVPETALQELDAIVEKQTQAAVSLRTAKIGGIRTAADIINFLDPDTEAAILEAIKSQDEELGDRIKDSLFIFDNLLSVDDRGMQLILREVESDSLALALKGADPPIREKIFNNMSKRASEILRDDIAAQGPVRLADVEEAQKVILTVAQRLAEEGQIMLGSSGDDFV